MNYALVAANVLIFVLDFNGGNARIDPWMLHPDEPQLHQFFSSIFLHASWMHLLGNMVFLWVFGNALNDRFGAAGYLAFYLAGGVLAGLGYLLLSAHAPVLGASGAISAVTGAYLVLFPRVRVTVLFFFFYILTPLQISSLVFLLIQFVTNMYMSMKPAITGQAAGGVAYAAHSAGYVFGIVAVTVLLATKILPRDAFDLLNLLRNAYRRSRYRHMVARGYDPFSATGAGTKRPATGRRRWVRTQTVKTKSADSASSREMELRQEVGEACARHDLPAAAVSYLELVQIAEQAILPRQQQLDVANQLMADNKHPAAADAYERFLKHYQGYEHSGDIYLMLGVLYGRYLHQYDRAEKMLEQAVQLLHDPRKIEMANGDLQRVRRRGQA